MRLPPVLSWTAGIFIVKTFFLSLIIGLLPVSHAFHISIPLEWSNTVQHGQKTLFTFRPLKTHIYDSAIEDFRVDFWTQTLALSKHVQKYSHVILEDATREFSDVSHKISELKENAAELVIQTRALREGVQIDWEPFVEEIASGLQDVLDTIKEEFPPPDTAPNHVQRSAMIGKTLQGAEDKIVVLYLQRGFPGSEDEIRVKIHPVIETLEKMATLVGNGLLLSRFLSACFHYFLGDIIEQHPDLILTITFGIVGMVFSEILLLRPLLGLFGWGPYGPVKGALISLYS
jgi:hypothetical protein